MLTTRKLLRYAVPMALSSTGGVLVGFTDTLIIGHYSTPALAGVALGASIYELPANALLGALMAYRIVQPRFAASEVTERSVAGLWLILRGLFPWAIAALGVLTATAATMILCGGDDPGSTSYQAGMYLLARSPSLMFEAALSAMTVTLISWGRVRTPLRVFVATSGLNLCLDLPLVYGVAALPGLGAFGDGLASTISVGVVTPLVAFTIRRLARPQHPGVTYLEQFEGWRRLSLPAVGSAALDYAGSIAFMALLATAGTQGLAGARVATATHLLAFVLVAALSAAALYVLGPMHAEDPDAALRARTAIRLRFIALSTGLGAILAALAWPIAWVSSPDAEVQTVANALVLVVAATCPVIGWTYANVSVLRAIERTGLDFLSNVVAVWGVQIPVAVAGLSLFGAPGAFTGLVGYWLSRGVVTHFQIAKAVKSVAAS